MNPFKKGNVFGKKEVDSAKQNSRAKPQEKRSAPPQAQNKREGGKPAGKPAEAPKASGAKAPPQKPKVMNQSAGRPVNTTGLQNKKDSAFVQFGPVLKEFLGSKELVDKSITVHYVQSSDCYDISVSFRTILQNGVSTSLAKSLKIEDYMAMKNVLLKKKDNTSLFVDFVGLLLHRLGINLTAAKPSVDPASIRTFVLKHLSPIEREILKLTQDEFDSIDSLKIPDMRKPGFLVIDAIYGSDAKRSEYLVLAINATGPIADIEPPNWIGLGINGISKASLLQALKLRNVDPISKEQLDSLDFLASQLRSGLDVKSEEEKINEDHGATGTGEM